MPDLPVFRAGQRLSANDLNEIVRRLKATAFKGPGTFVNGAFTLQRPIGGGEGDTITQDVTVSFVLIDDDIVGAQDYKPFKYLETDDITLTEEEVGAGYVVKFQDPPDDDYSANLVARLNRWGFKRRQLTLKYFQADPMVSSGTATDGDSTHITLDPDTRSLIDDFYKDDVIETTAGTGSGQTKTITAYNATTGEVTVDSAWSTAPDDTTEYEITSPLDKVLAYTVIDDPESDPPQKIVRYSTMTVYYDDGKPFHVGEYSRNDYPDYPENEAFPPDGSGTFPEQPEGYLKCRYRALVLNGTMLAGFCQLLPAPELITE